MAAESDPGDDLIGLLATACAGGQLERLTAQLILISLFSAGGESTASLIGNTVDVSSPLTNSASVGQPVRGT